MRLEDVGVWLDCPACLEWTGEWLAYMRSPEHLRAHTCTKPMSSATKETGRCVTKQTTERHWQCGIECALAFTCESEGTGHVGILLWGGVLLGHEHLPCLHMGHQVFQHCHPAHTTMPYTADSELKSCMQRYAQSVKLQQTGVNAKMDKMPAKSECLLEHVLWSATSMCYTKKPRSIRKSMQTFGISL